MDALPPHVLRDMVRDVIEQHISAVATAALRVAKDSERELLLAWGVDRTLAKHGTKKSKGRRAARK